jgi:hypothetical protein
VQEIEALVVGEERVGAVVEEKIDNVVVAALCRPEDGCCNRIAAFCVDGCASLDQEVAESVVIVDGSPLLAVSLVVFSSILLCVHEAVLCPARL